MEKSNYQMLLELGDFTPKKYGVLAADEVVKLREHFEIKERTNVELQNLRDFVVMFYSNLYERHKDCKKELDIMSAICGVIDDEKFKRGMEI